MYKNKALIGLVIVRISITIIASTLSVAIGWHLYLVTGSAFDLALVGLFQIVPIFLFTLLAGWVADHFSRKLILVVTSVLLMGILVGVAVIMSQPEFNKWYLFIALSLIGVGRAFFAPAMQAMLPNIVPPEQLNRAVALLSSFWNLALTVGPFMAGLLIAWIDRDLYWLLVAIQLVTLAGLLFLPNFKSATQRKSLNLSDLLGGIAYLRSNNIILGSMTIDLAIVFFGSVIVIFAVFVSDVLKSGPETLGLLRSMPAVGAMLMGIFLTGRKDAIEQNGKVLFITLVVFATSILLFALVHHIWIAALALFIYGASDMISVVIRSSILQILTPDELRGRVSSLNTLFIATSNEFGDFRAGSVTALIGPVAGALVGGVMAFGIIGASYYIFKPLRTLGAIKPPDIK